MTMPEAYTMPLTDRHEIAEYLLDRRSRYYRDHGHLLFCWNVKVYNPDLSFGHLLDLYRHSGYGGEKIDDPSWVEEARLRYEEIDLDNLFQVAVDDARRMVTDSDCFNHLYDGTPVEVQYEFVGRSGGWITLTHFEGFTLTDSERLKNVFEEDSLGEEPMSDKTLHRLYALVRILEHDLTPEKAQAEVEWQATFNFFENVCGDIPTAEANRGAGI